MTRALLVTNYGSSPETPGPVGAVQKSRISRHKSPGGSVYTGLKILEESRGSALAAGCVMRRPYKLITTDDPNVTLGEGEIRHYPSMLDAARAFVRDPAPFRQVIFDDGCVARELDDRERVLLEGVCDALGLGA
jgi:hypothetical protein